PVWRDKDEFLLRPYRDLEGFAAEVKTLEPLVKPGGHRQVKRFSGQLAEVKEAVAQARAWMEAGVPSDRIAILAPEIEDYWPVLKPYLDEEGLPADKAVSVKLNALPVVNRWLARLRPRRGELTPADLELAYYGFESSNPLRYEQFRSLFVNLYGEEDLHRHEAVRQFFEKKMSGAGGILPRDVFLEVASRYWENLDNTDAFLLIAREVLQNAQGGMELSLGDWIRYVESIAASKETTLSPAFPGGLFIGNFLSAHAHPATHRIFLGLSEEGLRKAERNPLPMKDIREISKLGFHLDHPDQSLLEFELKWLCETPATDDVLMVGVTSFDGAVRAPSALWMRYFQESHPESSAEAVQLPRAPRWDLLQLQEASEWKSERRWSENQTRRILQRLSLDLGEIEPEPVKTDWLRKISPSLVKTYLDCPFRLASSALFRLKDLNEVDVDLGRADVGNLTHAVFQTLTDEGWTQRESVSDEELQTLIEEVRRKLNFVFAEENLWLPFLKRQVRVAQEFLRVEREWKRNYPALQILKSETEWKIYFELESGEFSLTPSEEAVELRGRIDRLETDGQGRYVVVDYKASKTNLHHHDKWLGENEIQLLFYMWALEKGALPGLQGDVIGAFYYVYKNFTRDTGFQIEAEAGRLFPVSGRKKNLKAEVEEKEALFEELEERIRDVIARTSEGDWAPKPHENNKNGICERCAWNGLCRSSHLN
ncbi:MAG TPA: PD-(D/E)XK nuclease family protein, partial [Pseudobdellovibrionaceae bacterium]|nr:PD-(D/E)XK nuclease family protein [Pseudobdellovibrionaceae bacterium]